MDVPILRGGSGDSRSQTNGGNPQGETDVIIAAATVGTGQIPGYPTYFAGGDAAPGAPLVLFNDPAFQFPANSKGAGHISAAAFCVQKTGAGYSGELRVYVDGILISADDEVGGTTFFNRFLAFQSGSVPVMPIGVHSLLVQLETMDLRTIGCLAWYLAINFWNSI
jgi:hypothetical protein